MTGKCVAIEEDSEKPEGHPMRQVYVFRMLDKSTVRVRGLRLKEQPRLNETWFFAYRQVSNGYLFLPEVCIDRGVIEQREKQRVKPKRTEWRECV